MKYKYLGDEPTILIDFHITVSPGDENIEVDRPIIHPLFVLQEENPITVSEGDDL